MSQEADETEWADISKPAPPDPEYDAFRAKFPKEPRDYNDPADMQRWRDELKAFFEDDGAPMLTP